MVNLWLAGNSVNGDSVQSELDMWNRLTASVAEGTDDGNTRVVFSGNGTIVPPPPSE